MPTPTVSSSPRRTFDLIAEYIRPRHLGNHWAAGTWRPDCGGSTDTDYPGVNKVTASVIVNLLRNCAGYQFHDTSESSRFKNRWDVSEGTRLRSHGGNLAAVLYRLERYDLRRYELICRHIARILPGFERFDIEEDYGKVFLRWKADGTTRRLEPTSHLMDRSASSHWSPFSTCRRRCSPT